VFIIIAWYLQNLDSMVKKSRTLIFLIILISFLSLASIAEAQGGSIGGFFNAAAGVIRTWATYLGGVAFGFCAILIATSGGSPGRLAQVKEALAYIVVGLAVVQISTGFVIAGDIPTALGAVATALGQMAGIAGAMYLAYGIFEFATSGGDPGKLDDAKTAIMWGVIGIVVGGTTFAVTNVETAKTEILKILGAAATGMGAVSVALGIYKVATSVGDPPKLKEGITNIIWGAIGIIIGAILLTGVSPL